MACFISFYFYGKWNLYQSLLTRRCAFYMLLESAFNESLIIRPVVSCADVYERSTVLCIRVYTVHRVQVYTKLVLTWHCMDRVSSCNIYAVQQDTQCGLNEWVLFITYVSSTCFGLHRSIIRSVLYKLLRSNGWTCRVVRVLPHTKSANTVCKTLLMMDRWGPKHVELT